MRRTTSAIAVALALTISMPTQGAAAAPESRAPAKTTVTPLSADQTTLSNGTVSTAKLYRDSKGRTRVESGSQVTINDPVARTTIQLDSSNGTFQVSADKPSPRKATVEQENGVPGKMRTLGTAEINGVKVEVREHTVNLAPMAGLPARTKQVTLWLSTELRLAVQTRITDATGFFYEQSYSNIRAGAEPSADLFTVPAGYLEATPAATRAGTDAGINADCPVTVIPDPMLLESYGSYWARGIIGANTQGSIGCFFAADYGRFYYPMAGVPLTPLNLTTDQWLVGDTGGGGLPYLPYTTFGDVAFLAVNKDDQTVKDGLIILTVWCC